MTPLAEPVSREQQTAIFVRRLVLDDVELFRAVRLAALEDSPDAFGETLEAARQADWNARIASAAAFTDQGTFVALEGDRAVGMVFVRCEAAPAPAFLGGMWVHPLFRQRGVGRELVARGLKFLHSIGQREVSLWVTSAHVEVLRFYRKLGFEETGATATLRPGSPVTITQLHLYLSPGDT